MLDEDIKTAAKLLDEIASLESVAERRLVIAYAWDEKGGYGPREQGYQHSPVAAGDIADELREIVRRVIADKRAELAALKQSA